MSCKKKQFFAVDTCGRHYLDEAEVAAIGSVCAKCVGACCQDFSIYTSGTKDENGVVHFDAVKAGRDRDIISKRDCQFMAENLEVIQEGYESYCEGSSFTTQMRFRCKQHNKETGRCMAYDRRPDFCRRYACASAWLMGVPPSDDSGHLLQSQGPGGMFEGSNNGIPVSARWLETIGLSMDFDKYWMECKEPVDLVGRLIAGGARELADAVKALSTEELNNLEGTVEKALADQLAGVAETKATEEGVS